MRNCSNLLSLPAHKRKKKIFVPLPAESFTFTTTKQPNSQKTAGRWQETKGSKISLEDGPSPRRERENPSHGLSSHKDQQYYNFPLGKIQKPHPRVLSRVIPKFPGRAPGSTPHTGMLISLPGQSLGPLLSQASIFAFSIARFRRLFLSPVNNPSGAQLRCTFFFLVINLVDLLLRVLVCAPACV